MKVIFDCYGADLGPEVMVQGASDYAANHQLTPLFIGDEKVIHKEISKYPLKDYEVIHTDTFIENTEEPTKALRKKKDSSLVMALKLLKEKKADAVLSCGSTGALLAGGLFIIGRKEGIQRACLPVPIPKLQGRVCLLDAGANVDCSPEIIHSFAHMGNAYTNKVFDVEKPKVYLLNIGAEEGKGNSQTKESFKLLAQDKTLEFMGNLEARNVLMSDADVLVCDGFVGNIFLKTLEGFGEFLSLSLKKQAGDSLAQMGKSPVGQAFTKIKNLFDYKEVGAVPLLGIQELVFKAHGSSDAKAIYSSLVQIDQALNKNLLKEI